MHLTKSQSIMLAVGTILLFFTVTALVIQRSSPLPIKTARPTEQVQAPIEQEKTAPSAAPESKVVLGEFHRSEVKDGKKLWEIKARQGQYFPSTASAKLLDATLWVYQKEGDVVVLEAKEALLQLTGQSLADVEAYGGVKVTRDQEITMETERAIFHKDKNLVVAPGPVTLTSERFDLSGNQMEADLTTKEVRLFGDVSSVVKPLKKKEVK